MDKPGRPRTLISTTALAIQHILRRARIDTSEKGRIRGHTPLAGPHRVRDLGNQLYRDDGTSLQHYAEHRGGRRAMGEQRESKRRGFYEQAVSGRQVEVRGVLLE